MTADQGDSRSWRGAGEFRGERGGGLDTSKGWDMVVGLGVDLVEIARIERAMRNPRFVYRVLTDKERLLFRTPNRVAGRWAAKEAIFKAVGLPLLWTDIEILSDHFGAPQVTILTNKYDGKRLRLHVSITHEKNHAVAVAVLERVVIHVPAGS